MGVIASLNDDMLFDEAADCMCAVLQAPGAERYPGVVFAVLPHLLGLRGRIARAAQEEDEDVVLGVCRVLLALGERHTKTLLAPQAPDQHALALAFVCGQHGMHMTRVWYSLSGPRRDTGGAGAGLHGLPWDLSRRTNILF